MANAPAVRVGHGYGWGPREDTADWSTAFTDQTGGSDGRSGDGSFGGGGGDLPAPRDPASPHRGPTMPVGRSEGLGTWQPFENYLYTRQDTHGGRGPAPTGTSPHDRPPLNPGGPPEQPSTTMQNSAQEPDDAMDPQAGMQQRGGGGNPLVPGPGINGFLFGIR